MSNKIKLFKQKAYKSVRVASGFMNGKLMKSIAETAIGDNSKLYDCIYNH